MKRTPKPPAPPLAATLRAALASDWRTLAALDTLAGDPAGTRRHRVHAALRGLRGEGVVFEERTSKGVAEVRISPATLPAPRPDDGDDGLDADDREAARAAIQADLDAEPPCDPDNFEGLEGMRLCLGCEHPAHLHAGGPVGGQCLHQERGTECSCVAWVEPNARTAEPAPALDAPAPPVDQAAPVEAAEGPVARDLDALREQVRTNASVSVSSGLTMAQAWERASVCLDLTPVEEYALCGAFREEWERVTSRPVNALSAHLAAMGHVEEAREVAGLPARSREPGPSSRCAVCGAAYKRHDEGGAAKHVPGTCAAFKALPRGRPRVTPVAVASEAAPTTPAEPETSRGESPGEQEQDHETCDTDTTRPDGSGRVPALRVAVERAPGKPRVPRPRAHPVPSADGVDQSAARVGEKDVATAGDVAAPPCRPPLCHADSIHEPSVQGFAKPLCERHRAWVEQAGGTVAPCPACKGVEPTPLQQRCVGIAQCAACGRALETLPMGAPRAPKAETV